MTALTKDRNTAERDGDYFVYPVGAGKKIHAGSLVVLDAGLAEPGNTAVNLVAVGRAEHSVDNTGFAAGASRVNVKRGVFYFDNTAAVRGSNRLIIDNVAVGADVRCEHRIGGNTRSVAGIVFDADIDGVWVKF
ncbi:MAG: hypothetical protein ABL893_15845 [Hyphomicrobium sp.]